MMKIYKIRDLVTDKINGEWGDEPKADSLLNTKVLRTTNFSNDGRLDLTNIAERFIEKKIVTIKRLLPGDVIIEKSGGSPTQPVGRVVFFENFPTEIVCNNFTSVLRPNQNFVDPKFFFYCLFYNHLTKKTLKFQNKTTGIINLKLENYLEENIKVPDSIETQQQIVAVLDKAQSIIDKRKASLQLLDQLLRDTYLDMFLKFESKNIISLSEVASVTSGLTKGKNYSGKKTRFVPYMRVANVQDGYLDLNEIKEIEATPDEIESFNLQPNDLLLTEGGDPDKLGRGTVWKNQISGCIFQNHIFRVRVSSKEKINPLFLSFQTGSSYGKRYFLKSAKQTTGIASINSTQLKRFPVFLPPINLQNKFAAIAEQSEALKVELQQNLNIIEKLFSSILQKAFNEEGITVNTKELGIQNKIADVKEAKAILEILPYQSIPKKEQVQVKQLLGNLDGFLGTSKIFKSGKEVDNTLQQFKLGALSKYTTVAAGNTFSSPGSGAFSRAGAGTFYTINTRGSNYPEQVQVNENFIDLLKDFDFKKLPQLVEKIKTTKLAEAAPPLEIEKQNGGTLPVIQIKETKPEEQSKEDKVTQPSADFDALKYVQNVFPGVPFRLRDMEASLDSPMYEHLTLTDMRTGIFKAIDTIIKTNLQNKPVTFQEIVTMLREHSFLPEFMLLHEYVMEKLEADDQFLVQVYFDEKMADINPQAYKYLQQINAQRRIYLLLNSDSKPKEEAVS